MILTLDQPRVALLSRAEDRSLGEAGVTLRELFRAQREHSAVADRGADVYSRLSAALHRSRAESGTLLHPDAFSRTLELLMALPREVPLPDVVVESETEIGLDWDLGRRQVLSLTVRDTPMVGFSALFGQEPLHGRFVFAGDDIPETLQYLFSRLFRRRTR